MDTQYIHVDTGLFRSRWILVAAICAALAALLGLPGTVMLFRPAYMAAQLQALAESGIASTDAQLAWLIINSATTALGFVCAAFFAASLLLELGKEPGKGLDLMYRFALVAGYVLIGAGILLAVVLAYRVIVYVAGCLMLDTGIYMIYSMLVSEAILVVLVWFAFVNLRRFLSCLCDSTLSMAVTLSCGKLDTTPIPAFTATGFLVLGILCLVIGFDRLVTLTVIQEVTYAYYALLPVEEPLPLLEGASFLCAGAANLLVSFYLRRYKRICEKLLHARWKETMSGVKENM